jgi:hypothetical protein
MLSSVEIGKNSKLLAELPVVETGIREISTTYSGLVLRINFGYYCDIALPESTGVLTFDYCNAYCLVDQNRFPHLMPPTADSVYELPSVVSANQTFFGFAVWLSDTRTTYIVYAKKFDLTLDHPKQ